jgi:tRNA (cytidine/uridine-2'-O-)-methyltransferase
MLRLALYQPDIPQNTGTLLRMAACLGLAVEIIEPAGFDVSDRHLRRSGLRLVLATTAGALPYTAFGFRDGDCVLMGRESAGVPEGVHAAADARVFVPMRPGMRSLNVAVSAAMIVGEALRQTARVN